jgi:CRISPR system Cascade subunit CasB
VTPAVDEKRKKVERPELDTLGNAVHNRLTWLQEGYVNERDVPLAVQNLAELRRGAGRLPEDVPEFLGEDYGLDEVWIADDRPIRAAHVALTLYARHQQSLRTPDLRMYRWHSPGTQRPSLVHNLGWAVRRLMPAQEISSPIRQRFVQVGKATTVTIMAERMRGLIDLMRRDRIPLDYALLAEHMLLAQRPGGMRQVRRAWDHGFNAYRPPKPTAEQTPADDDTDHTDKDAP